MGGRPGVKGEPFSRLVVIISLFDQTIRLVIKIYLQPDLTTSCFNKI